MKRLITILVVSVLSVISTNSSAVAGDACDACKWKVQYISEHEGDFTCDSLQNNDVVQSACEAVYSSSVCSQTSSWTTCNQVLYNDRDEEWCDNLDVCSSSGGGSSGGGSSGGGSSNTCPSDCVTAQVSYRELNDDTLEVTTRYCNSSTLYQCRTKTETVTLSTEKLFDSAGDGVCSNGTCVDWDCVWTEGVGTTCPSLGAGGTKPFCTCTVYTGNSLKTVAVRLGCNSTDSSGYNCNQGGTDDEDSNKLYCDLTASTSAGAGVCRYKKTCTTDCTNAWNAVASNNNYLYRLKGKCDYTTGSCVSNGGTVVGDFDYKCNHDNRAYETATTATCKRMSGGKPATCSGCKRCLTTNAWEDASNPAYQQQYHYNFSPISGTDKYQCVKTMDSLYQCNKGYYGNPGSSMTGCNACPTLASSGLTIVSQNENCSNRLVNTGIDGDYWQLDVVGATTISQCYAMTGNQDDSSYCGATLNDGSGTFYWYDDYIKGTETVCFYQ
mgnify:CR=1 FL=1